MKIKVRPEDFIVEETLGTSIAKKGEYALYQLTKKGENTVELIQKIADDLRLPFENFSYGGRKDRHALTTQHITIKNLSRPFETIEEKNYSLVFLGFLDRPMGPDLIESNCFRIKIRDLSEEESRTALAELPEIQKSGYSNYFDDQRFGSFDTTQGFLAEKILKKHDNGALKIYLTHIGSDDRKEERERKAFFLKNWGAWRLCMEKAQSPFEKTAFSHFSQNPKDFIFLLRKIPRGELSSFFSCYQSYLWNEVLKRLIKEKKSGLYSSKGAVGEYLFYRSLDPRESSYWQGLTIPTVASNMKVTNDEIGQIYGKVLEENGLRLPMFNLTKTRQAFFKTIPRYAVVRPQNLSFQKSEESIDRRSKTLTLTFGLPRGSYATMLIKRLFTVKTI